MKTDKEMIRWALEESSEPVIKNPLLKKDFKKKMKITDYVDGMNHLYSNGPRPKGNTHEQLTNLNLWGRDPAAYAKKISKEKIQKRLDRIRGPHDFEVIWESMSPIERGQFNAQRRKHGEPIYVQKKIRTRKT